MTSTKINILNTARALFNEQGYSQVTIRAIALKLNMSSGNLNYHYKKREDILEALYFEMVAVFDARIEQLGENPISLESMKKDIYTSMERMVAYRFFWTDLYNLLPISTKINTHFEQAYRDRKAGTKHVFTLMKEQGIMQPPSFKQEHALLIERMISFSNTWLYASSLYKKDSLTDAYIDRQATMLLSMLYPYLTPKGEADFRALVPGYFS